MKFLKNPKIFSKKIKGKWFILEINQEYTQELNETDAFIWEMLTKALSKEEIIDKICQHYQVTKTTVTKDVNTLIKLFLKKGFLIKQT